MVSTKTIVVKLSVIVSITVIICTITYPGMSLLEGITNVPSYGMIKSAVTRLHTDGSYIKNEDGQIVQLSGVSWWDLGSDHSLPEVEGRTEGEQLEYRIQRTKLLGINLVRIHIGQGTWENYQPVKSRLDYVAKRCLEVGIYILIDFHYGSTAREWWGELGQALLMANHNAVLTPGSTVGYLDWVKNVAVRYKDNTAVIGYQNWAEPGWGNYSHDVQYFPDLFAKWRSFNIDVFNAIRSVSPNSLFVVLTPGHYTFKEVHDLWIENPMPQPNVVYGVQRYLELGLVGSDDQWLYHRYYINGNYEAGKAGLETYLRKYYFDFLNYSIGPVVNCEFGFYDSLSRPEERRIASDFYDLHRKYYANWIQFAWSPAPKSDGGGSEWGILDTNKGWDYSIHSYPLTASGQLMVQYLQPLP